MSKKFTFVYIILLFFTFTAFGQSGAKDIPVTGDWEPAGVLYSDDNVSVEIEFKLSKEGCDSTGLGNSNHLFRYIVTGLKKPLGVDKYVTFKIVYQDCFGRLICKTNNLNIGNKKKNDVWDGVQPLSDTNSDNFFRGQKLVVPFMEVRTSFERDPSKDSECYKKTVTIPQGAKTKKNTSTNPNEVEKKLEPNPQVTSNPLSTPPSKTTQISRSKKSDLRIKGPQGEVVKGQKIRLELSDPGDNEWNWYEESCNGALLKTGSSFLDIIVVESTTFYAKPIVKNSNREICLNYYIFVDSLSSLSVPPSEIIASKNGVICKGDTAKMYQIGGILGTDAQWEWFEKGGNTPIFTGDTLKVVPNQNMTYSVRAKGKFNVTEMVDVSLVVNDYDFPNRKIIFSLDAKVCPNQPIKINLSGGNSKFSSLELEWSNVKGELLHKGSTPFIYSSPISNEIYATYRGCAEEKIYSKSYEVTTGSKPPNIVKLSRNDNLYEIKLQDEKLMDGSSWNLYYKENDGFKKIGSFKENSFNFNSSKKEFYMRAEGNCDTTEFFKINSEKKINKRSFYVVPGISLFPGTPKLSEKTFSLAFGELTENGGWYILAKSDISNDIYDYKTNNTALTDFSGSSTYYYTYNSKVLTNRQSLVVGLHKKIGNGFFFNLGAGYGKRDLLWGVDVKTIQTGGIFKNSLALNTIASNSGVEVNTGFTIKGGPLAIRFDVNVLGQGFSTNSVFAEASIGVGFAF